MLVAIADGPGISRVFPCGPIPPITEHPDGGEPANPRVVPKIAILPVQTFVAGIVQIVPKQTCKSLGRHDRAAGAQGLTVSGDLEVDAYRLVGAGYETRSPTPKVVESKKQALLGGTVVEREPRCIGGTPHLEFEFRIGGAWEWVVGVKVTRFVCLECFR